MLLVNSLCVALTILRHRNNKTRYETKQKQTNQTYEERLEATVCDLKTKSCGTQSAGIAITIRKKVPLIMICVQFGSDANRKSPLKTNLLTVVSLLVHR